jgi:hypothetical protein
MQEIIAKLLKNSFKLLFYTMFFLAARVVSVIFHPLFLTSYAFAALFYTMPQILGIGNIKLTNFLFQSIVMITAVFPIVFIFLLKRMKFITSIELHNRHERLIPFLGVTFIYAIATYLATFVENKLSVSPKIAYFLFSITISLTFLIVSTLFFKISAHCLAIGGIFGAILALAIQSSDVSLAIPLAIAVFLMGLVATARLLLEAHSFKEIWAGLGVGFGTNFLILSFLL